MIDIGLQDCLGKCILFEFHAVKVQFTTKQNVAICGLFGVLNFTQFVGRLFQRNFLDSAIKKQFIIA